VVSEKFIRAILHEIALLVSPVTMPDLFKNKPADNRVLPEGGLMR